MALTAEDIVNKRFQSTKFREGYDQDEVDDFLDEVVVEMRRVLAENDDLSQKLAASEARIAELQRSGGSASTVGVNPLPSSGGDVVDAENANNLLQLARRLHEEHVREGIQKRDELIAEGHAQAARIVQEAETEHAQATQRLTNERRAIEGEVEQLRNFEREYRASLKAFINQQVQSLDSPSLPPARPEGV
jgi:DivIVA domain-containing protein